MAESGGTGMPWDTIAKVGTNLTAGIVGASGAKKSKKQLEKLIANRPKYELQQEAFDNQAIAKGLAYGRNRAIQQQEQNIDKGVKNSISDVQDVSSSTSSLLATIAAINANAASQKRDLGGQEAVLQQQGKETLMGANNAMIDEKDKAWNFNTNMPYQLRVAALRDKQKYNQELQLGAAS